MFHYAYLLNITEYLVLIFTVLGLLIASVGVLITVKGLGLAHHALKQWKIEKEWDIVIEAKTFAETALSTLINTRQSQEIINYILKLDRLEPARTFAEIANQSLLLINTTDEQTLKNNVKEVKRISEKLKHVFPERFNIVSEYYREVASKISAIESSIQQIKMIEHGLIYITNESDPCQYVSLNNQLVIQIEKLFELSQGSLEDISLSKQEVKEFRI